MDNEEQRIIGYVSKAKELMVKLGGDPGLLNKNHIMLTAMMLQQEDQHTKVMNVLRSVEKTTNRY